MIDSPFLAIALGAILTLIVVIVAAPMLFEDVKRDVPATMLDVFKGSAIGVALYAALTFLAGAFTLVFGG